MSQVTSELESIWRCIDPARLTALLVDAVQHYSPPYAEQPALRVFAAALERAGARVRLQPVPAAPDDVGRGNLIVEVGPQPPELLWVGHVDTVTLLGDEPPAAVRDGDILHGLGTADMKGGCAAIVEAVAAVIASGLPLRRGLCVGLVVGEEEYGDGAQALCRAVSAPLTVIGEPTALVPCVDHYAYLELRLTSRGTAAHAALPEVGASAIHAMLVWLLQIIDSAPLLPHAPQIALNPRAIRGGDAMFVVADACEALLDIHLPPGAEPASIEALLGRAREQVLLSNGGCTLDYETVYWAAGYSLDREEPRLLPLARAYGALGMPWMPGAFRSHSDGNLFYGRGTLPVICGPGRLEVAHTRGERVSIAEVERAARLYSALIWEACVR